MTKYVFEITREFVSKDHGHIGTSGWRVAQDGSAEMLDGTDWVDIPDSSRDALALFALQTLQDAYAGKTTKAEAIGSYLKKRDGYIAGTIGTRSTSWDSVARELVVASLIAGDKEFGKLKGDARKARVAGVLDKNKAKESFKALVDGEIAKRKAEADRLKAVTNGIDL
jgi:hypothetical protein